MARRLSLHGEAVQDERQLDGSRHLTIEGSDSGDGWALTVHMVLTAEGDLHEAEIQVNGPDDSWSAALDAVKEVEEEPLAVLARFSDETVAFDLELEAAENGAGYSIVITLPVASADPGDDDEEDDEEWEDDDEDDDDEDWDFDEEDDDEDWDDVEDEDDWDDDDEDDEGW